MLTGAGAAVAGARAAGAGEARMLAWRAHAYGGAHEVRLERARVPALRAPDHVLVRVRAASINPIDIAMLGGYGHRALNALRGVCGAGGGGGVEFPLVVGRDFVGEVAAAGAGARLRRGARVWGVLPPHWPGAHQQYALVRDRWAGEAPRALGALSAGGALYAALTACAALRAAGVPAGRRAGGARVLVLGLGGVGQAAVQLLAAVGARVLVGCAGEAGAAARALGAAAALDRHAPDYGSQLEDGGPYSAIIDCAGLGGREAGARRWRFARYVTLTTPLLRETDARGLVGVVAAGAELARQCADAARAGATAGTALPPHVRWAYFAPCAADIELVRRLAERGQFGVAVERAYAWRRAADAYAHAARGHARGKLLIDFADDAPAHAHDLAPH